MPSILDFLRRLRIEFRYSGDRALSEMYAFLFQYLITDAEWLRSVLGMRAPESFIRVLLLDKLMMCDDMRASSITSCGCILIRTFSSNSKAYVEKLTQATRFQYEPEEFLADVMMVFISADYLRAWAFEVMLRDYLQTKYGRVWWRNRRAERIIEEMWNRGTDTAADELVEQVGAGKFSIEPVIDEFLVGLK